ncbi:HPP family protein [Beauveria brongniartii RCEF 3172]|uniref:HPP family protein n=1 Tax=Beauveria brongniartii RCEF 3172 TaxID=1081107 RepID=A0A167L8P5_9HYPO|nr:HPP family protein [Beauveria brongniartii RCEF 3172]
MPRPTAHHAWNFDIDRYLNPIIPSPPWRYMPYPVAHFLGHRRTKPANTGNLMPTFWAFIGIFCAIIIVQVTSTHIPAFESHHVPAIVGSFGATAVLEFYAIESPLSQPRNTFIGQALASVIGVAVAKLFLLSDNFESIQYIGGALACAATTSLMALTKTVHPPAGATALLAVVDNRILGLGWFLIPVMMLGCSLMVSVALVINNIERRYPVYWWTPESLKAAKKPILHRSEEEDPESFAGSATTTNEEKPASEASSDAATAAGAAAFAHRKHELNEVIIRPGEVLVPQDMFLTQEEAQLLETLSRRL